MLRVTFDSNVWRIVADPGKFPREPSRACFETINQALHTNQLLACLAETIFTLEGVKRTDRKEFFASYVPAFGFVPEILPDGQMSISMSIEPDPNHHPGNNRILAAHLRDALDLGFRLLRCPRIAVFKNPDILEHFFLADTEVPMGKRQDTFARCVREIESRGCGIAHLKEIGMQYAGRNQSWQYGIANAPDGQEGRISKAFGEWADGDSVAAHIAYANRYFCTRDIAKSGGPNSILAPRNRSWLTTTYNTEFVTPEELADKLGN